MKKIELALGLIAVFGFILKLLHLPGGAFLNVVSLTTLSMFYMLFGFALFNGIRFRDIAKKGPYQDTNSKRIIGATGLGFALALVINGAAFKLLFLPGAKVQLMLGLAMVGIILPVAIFFYRRNKAEFYIRAFKRMAICGGLGLLLFSTPSATLVDIYYGDKPEYAELYKKVLADPKNRELQEQLRQMDEEMERQEFQEKHGDKE